MFLTVSCHLTVQLPLPLSFGAPTAVFSMVGSAGLAQALTVVGEPAVVSVAVLRNPLVPPCGWQVAFGSENLPGSSLTTTVTRYSCCRPAPSAMSVASTLFVLFQLAACGDGPVALGVPTTVSTPATGTFASSVSEYTPYRCRCWSR